MPTHALWVHGTSVHQDTQGFYINELRAGWGAEFQSTGYAWFQFAIPTPVILADKRAILNKVFVLYKAERGARVTALHLWDGPTKGQRWDNLNLSGDHSAAIDNENSWLPNAVPMSWGLGISVGVDFGQSSLAGVPKITFSAAGADFSIP